MPIKQIISSRKHSTRRSMKEGQWAFANTPGFVARLKHKFGGLLHEFWSGEPLFVDGSNKMKPGTILSADKIGAHIERPSYTFSVGSTDKSDQIGIYHDNTDAYFKTTDGIFVFVTDEGTNTITNFAIKGKGTGRGELRVHDQDDAEYVRFTAFSGAGFLDIQGASPGVLKIQDVGQANVRFFSATTENITRELQIYGFRSGDLKRSLEIGVGVDAADTASFDGLSNYYFDGNVGVKVNDPHSALEVAGAISSATATITENAVDLDVSGINTLFVNPAGGTTITGFTNGVAGQALFISALSNGQDITMVHNVGDNQRVFLHTGASETLSTEYGGWTLTCDGTHWYDTEHSKHV